MNPRPPPDIRSAANPVFKKLMALQTAHGIRKHGEFLVAGTKVIAEAMRQNPGAITAVITTPDMPAPPSCPADSHLVILSKERFREVNLFGAPGPLLLMRAPVMPAFRPDQPWPNGCTLFLPFGDPENVGSAIRAAAGLGAARVILLQEAACPFLPKAIRAAAGTTWKVNLQSGPGIAKLAGSDMPALFALDMAGSPLQKIKPPAAYGLVAGMEGQGLPESLRNDCRLVSIDMANGVESLNAASAIAIALWAWR